MTQPVYREQDADRVIVLISSDGGVTWVPDVNGGAGGGGGGAVNSVDGRTGTVTLTDLYDAAGDAAAAQLAAEAASDPVGAAATAAAAAVVTAESYTDTKHALALKIANDLSDLHSASTARTNLGLGTAATTAASAYDVAGAAAAAQAASQPLDSDLTTIAALTATTDSFLVAVASAWAARTPAQVKATLALTESDITGLVADLLLKAPLASPALTGTPTAPTQTAADNSTKLATTAYADVADNVILAAAQAYVNAHSLPLTLASNKFLVGDGSGLAQPITISGDVTTTNAGVVTIKSSVALAGSPTSTTQTAGDNSTKLATTAYVDVGLALKAPIASPAFTGTPTAPTATALTSNTQVATTAYADAAVAAAAAAPTGGVQMYGGATAPAGFVLCDGTSYLRAGAMAALFAVVGTTFGSADGTHFNVPDMRDREVLGKSATHALGATGGSTTHGHTHSLTLPLHVHDLGLHAHTTGAMWADLSMPAGLIVMNQIAISPTWTDNQRATATISSPAGSARGNGTKINGQTDNASGNTGNPTTTPSINGSVQDNTSGPIDPWIAMNYIIKT